MARSASATDMIPFGGSDEPLLHGGDACRRPASVSRRPRTFHRPFDRDQSQSLSAAAAFGRNCSRACRIRTRLPRSPASPRTAYGAPSAAHVVPAPGTQILLPLVAGLVRPGRAAVLAPTYCEHARAAALAGHRGRRSCAISAACADADIAYCHQSQQSGRPAVRQERSARRWLNNCSARGGVLVVDEAFMDVGPPGASLAGEVSRGNIVVLRSFGKFFGLAGLRLGFALAAPPLAARLAALLGPWAVSGAGARNRRAGPGGSGLDRRRRGAASR